jgi:hypothetical protein
MFTAVSTSNLTNTLWHIDPLLGNDRETNIEKTAIGRQLIFKYATVLEPLLGNGPHLTMKVLLKAVFSMCSAPILYHSTDRVQCSAVELVGW